MRCQCSGNPDRQEMDGLDPEWRGTDGDKVGLGWDWRLCLWGPEEAEPSRAPGHIPEKGAFELS